MKIAVALSRVRSDLRCFVLLTVLAISSAAQQKAGISSAAFDKANGKPVEIYTLTNKNGMEARIMTYGGTVVSLRVPDRTGKLGDVVLGYDSLADYQRSPFFFGALIG